MKTDLSTKVGEWMGTKEPTEVAYKIDPVDKQVTYALASVYETEEEAKANSILFTYALHTIQRTGKLPSQMEGEIKRLKEAIKVYLEKREQYDFFSKGYALGSASISETMAASDNESNALQNLQSLL